MASNQLSNEYSDHSILVFSVPLSKKNTSTLLVKQLNVAQLGRMQLFPNNENDDGFNWSSTLRTVTLLKLLAEKKPELTKLGYRLLEIANDITMTVKERNEKIVAESTLIMKEMNELGFPLKSFKMLPSRLFNPGVSRDDLYSKADQYVQSPAYVLEDSESFGARMRMGFKEMFNDNPGIVCIQEMETGTVDGIDFDSIHNEIMQNYPMYEAIKSPLREAEHTIFTYYLKDKFNYLGSSVALRGMLKCFCESSHKIQVSLLEHVESGKVFTVGNIHAEYMRSNTKEPWFTLREMFDSIPNFIMCGDFNLKPVNESYFSDAMYNDHFGGKYKLLLTPEPKDVGNPTYDLIIAKVY